MDDCAEIEIRTRLIFLFLVLEVNTITAWMGMTIPMKTPILWSHRPGGGGRLLDVGRSQRPEHYRAGLNPARTREK